VTVNGPKASSGAHPPRHHRRAGRRGAARHAPTDRGGTAPCRADALARGEHGRGVTAGFSKTLEIQGVGYRAVLKGKDLELALGYSHPVRSRLGRHHVRGAQPTRIIVSGISKRPSARSRQSSASSGPGALQGKGIRYEGEYVAGRSASGMSVRQSPARLSRRRRVRAKVSGTAERPRISVFVPTAASPHSRRRRHGRTLAAVSWTEADLRALKGADQASAAGKRLAERAKAPVSTPPCRSRRLPVPRARQGIRRRRARGGLTYEH